jgi:hypothetical protein
MSSSIPQMRNVPSSIEFEIEASDGSVFDWNFPNITDALGVLATCIGQAVVNLAVISGTLTEWHADIAASTGVMTQWRLRYRKI